MKRRRRLFVMGKRRFYRRLYLGLLLIFIIVSGIFCVKSFMKHSFTVCIDPGHGEYDTGAVNQQLQVKEKDLVLDVALKLGEILEDKDIKVVYTRDTDDTPWNTQKESLKGRCEIADDAHADIFISIHANAYKGSSKIRGTEIWCRFENTHAERLGKEISEQLENIGFTENKGLKYEKDQSLYVLRNTKAISVLVELGYLSNFYDTQFLKSEEGKNACADAIAQAIINYKKSVLDLEE